MTDISLRYLLFGEDKSASSTAGKVGKSFHKLGSTIGGEFGEILSKAGEGIDELGEHAHSMGAKITGVGTVVAGLGVGLQVAGSKEKAGAEQLNAAIDATGKAHEDYAKEVEEAIKSNEKFSFGAADTQQALAKLTAATNSPDKALANMGVTANLAASQHISMADAAKMVARVLGGSGGRTLAQYGIAMDKTKSKTAAGQEALDTLSGKLKGQAAASVDSFTGKLDVWKTKIGDTTAQIGQKLGPALTAIGPALMIVGTITEIVATRKAAAAAATEAETVATGQNILVTTASAIKTGIMAAATGAWTGAQWLLNAALNANPIGLVVIAIGLLIAAFIIAWKHSETFRNIVKGAMHDVMVAASAVGNWFKGIAKWIGDHLKGVGSAITKPFTAAFGIIMTGIHAIEDAWNAVTGALGGGGPKPSSLPQSPANRAGLRGHAAGTTYWRGGAGTVNEQGKEIIDLPDGSRVYPAAQSRRMMAGGGGGTTVNIYLPVGTADYARAAREIEEVMRRGQVGTNQAYDFRVASARAVG